MDKKIYLTVDVECHDYNKINQYIYGNTKKGVYGLERILLLGKELDVPINIFLDVPECHVYGDKYIHDIVNLINNYNQPIFLHVHPDYILDPKRKHLWEYTQDEQKIIIEQALEDYQRLCGKFERLVFRAGAWGVNADTYEVLSELRSEHKNVEIIDLSYVYKSRWRCHLSFAEFGAANASKYYKNVIVFPNTTYIGFDYFGKQYPFELCVPNPSYQEFKDIIDNSTLNSITYTMHSWDFIKRWFFIPGFIAGNKRQIRIFRKCVKYAREKGYEFSDLRHYQLREEEDESINLCSGIIGKIKCLWYNYIRFADIGRSFKKYSGLYFMPMVLVGVSILLVLIEIL